MLDRGVHPVVPTIGSVGEADLAILAHLALPLVGLGFAELDGEILAGDEALRRAGIAPPALAPRDGLALCSSNAFAIGAAALAVHDALRLLDTANAAVALTLEGFEGNPTPTEPRVVAARPFPGHAWAAGSDPGPARWQRAAHAEQGPRLLQDPLPFRCAPVVHGSAREALERLRARGRARARRRLGQPGRRRGRRGARQRGVRLDTARARARGRRARARRGRARIGGAHAASCSTSGAPACRRD